MNANISSRHVVLYLFTAHFLLTLYPSYTLAETWLDENMRFWTSENGLAVSDVKSISRTKDGGLLAVHPYIPSLSKLDGLTVKTIPSPSNLFSAYEDQNGAIWALNSDGLHYQNNNDDDDDWHHILLPFPVGEQVIFQPLEEGFVLFVFPDRLTVMDTNPVQTVWEKHVSETVLDEFRLLAPSQSGEWWVAGSGGYAKAKLILSFGKWSCQWTDFQLPEPMPCDVLSIYEDEKARLTLVVDYRDHPENYLYRIHNANIQVGLKHPDLNTAWSYGENDFIVYLGSKIRYVKNEAVINLDKQKTLTGIITKVMPLNLYSFWISSSLGLVKVGEPLWNKPDFETQYEFTEFEKMVFDLFQDSQQNVWFKCENSIARLSHGQWKWYPNPSFYRGDSVSKLFFKLSTEQLLAGINKEGNYISLDLQTGSYSAFPASNPVKLAQRQSNGMVLTYGQNENNHVIQQITGAGTQTVFQWDKLDLNSDLGAIQSVTMNENGEFWIAGTRGLAAVQPGTGQWKPFSRFENTNVQWVYHCAVGELMVLSNNVLYAYKNESGVVLLEAIPNIQDILEASTGDLWFATVDGLFHFKDDIWTKHTVEDGLPSDVVYSLLEDTNHTIWAGTSLGPVQFMPHADRHPPQTYLDKNQNLMEFSSLGVARFETGGKDVWNQTPAEKLSYSARLNQGEWSPFSAKTEVKFSDLTPGDYLLYTRAMDTNRNIDPTPASLTFYVLTPWYLNTPFLISIFLLTGLLGLIAVQRIRYYLARDAILRDLLASQTKVRQLEEILPICSSCKKIRTEQGDWNQLEAYISKHSNTEFTHSYCPECMDKMFEGHV